MADAAIGRSGPMIRAPGTVERAGSATDDPTRREERDNTPAKQRKRDPERRSSETGNRQRRRLFDLLFDEIEQVAGLDPRQKERLKRNLRAHLVARPPPPSDRASSKLLHEIAQALAGSPAAPAPPPDLALADPDSILGAVAPDHPDQPPEDAAENAELAAQLRECLGRRTDAARKVAFYLHLLLSLDGAFHPHVVLEV